MAELSRRSLLSTSGILTASLLAGCGQPSTNNSDETSVQTEAETTKSTARSATAADTAATIEATLDQTDLVHGESITVTIDIENTEDEEFAQTLSVSVGGHQLKSQSVSLSPGETTQVELTATPPDTGTQTVAVGDREIGTVVVRAAKPDTVRDVGAHYYPWYGAPLHSWNDGEWSLESPSTPVLGNYNSTDPDVIEQHIDWCRQAGISWLNVSWWGRHRSHDNRLQQDILEHPRADELEWSILYETTGRLGSEPVEFDDNVIQSEFADDLSYLAETYFQRDAYKHIDGRPVLYIWVAQNLRGDVRGAYEAAVEAAGVRPYLIVDIPTQSGVNASPIVEVADAVTTYSVYDPQNPTVDAFVEAAQSSYRSWYRAAEYVDVDVIPTAVPGFDDTEITHVQRDNEPVQSTPEIYEQTANAARRYADGPILVTSFNEWYEDTQIEPSEEHGTAYLDITANALATEEREEPTFDGETFTVSFDRTVSESAMNPDVENGRQLTFMLQQLTIRNANGQAELDADIGTGVDEVAFILGSYGPEQSDDNTWQWLGGGSETVISVPSLPESGQVELTGQGAGEMPITLKIDGQRMDTTTITDQFDTYTLSIN
ncbi:glycoside hydrolase family 99-like domain-containing protein [Halobaculum rubrum]|uniref:glycoside hydrolase family 99-like domain-containing protein n=1 Tax=Halobaculum rubrum TaxID=2872158 RepID=UPI001CA43A6B|nr:glycoside hydrolase family 99-like domain-containing protein [Halobaculum rubrum]QZY01185.1 glycoside hydrolase family 99-like domain-containing protein [Halobaculum rubrum]